MIRVVLDTNILISALLSPVGPPAQVFLMTLADPDTRLCVSGDIYAEYDPDDDVFLECAQAAAAHYLVTGNAKDFPTIWASTQIVTARQFLDAVI
jgi:predicted nucleic acid-binding protein